MITITEINEMLMSDEFDKYLKEGCFKAIVLEDNTVSIVSEGIIVTNPIPVEQKQ